jgi:hypothetical protein
MAIELSISRGCYGADVLQRTITKIIKGSCLFTGSREETALVHN